MVIHRAATALLLIASLFMAVAISRADVRPTVRPNKMAALRRDAHGQGYVADAVASAVLEPECDGEGKEKHHKKKKKHHKRHHHHNRHDKEPKSPEPKPRESPEPKPQESPEPKPELGQP